MGSTEMEDLSMCLQKLGLHHKVAVSLEKTEPHYILDIAAQDTGGNDSLVAASSSNYTVRLFSRSHLAQTGVLTGHEDLITGIRFLHEDPNLVMTASEDKTVRIWDSRRSGSKEVQLFTGEDDTLCRILSCDVNKSDRVLCGGTEKTEQDAFLLFWDRRKNKLLGCYKDSHDDDVTQVRFHPTSEQSLLTGSTDGLVNIFDITKTSVDDALMSTYNTEATVERAGWCGPEAKHVYSTTHMCTWHVWDSESDDDIQRISGFAEMLEGKCQVDYLVDCIPAATSSDEVRLVAGSHSGDLHLLDASDPEEVKVVRSLVGGHSDTVRGLHWDRETETLVTGGEDSLLCLWSADTAGATPSSTKQGKVKGKKMSAKKRTTPYSSTRS